MWFVVIVAGLAGAIRVLLPRRFAELQQQRLRDKPVSRERLKSLVFLLVGAVFAGIYFMPWGHQAWLAIGAIFPSSGPPKVFSPPPSPTHVPLFFHIRT